MLKRPGICASLLALLFSAKSAPQDRSALSSSAFQQGISVSIDGSAPLRFGLDTGGGDDFFITPEAARKLALPVIGHRIIHTSDRQSALVGDQADIVNVKTLSVAGHVFTGPEGVVLPDSRHDGTLGIPIFHDVLLTLDYPNDRLTISEGALPPPNGRDVLAYTTDPQASFRPLRVSPTVTVQLAGHSLKALLDTGARNLNADLVIPRALATTLPLGEVESVTSISDAGGRSFASETRRLEGDLTLGNITLHRPLILISDWLGFAELARVSGQLTITIDQRNHRLRLTMP